MNKYGILKKYRIDNKKCFIHTSTKCHTGEGRDLDKMQFSS